MGLLRVNEKGSADIKRF